MIFVIDACIACSMGGPEAVDPTSKNCFDVLFQIFDQSHKIAVSDKLFDEYEKHYSGYFNDWFLTMIRKSSVEYISGCENLKLRDQIKANICKHHKVEVEQKAIIAIVCKDVHLLEAALPTDKFIISNDKKCRNQLIRLMNTDEEKFGISIITWVIADEHLIDWFKDGASEQRISEEWRLS